MADPVTEPPADTPPPRGARKRGLPPKLLGLPTPVVLAGGAALAALGFLWLRSRRQSAAGAAAPTASATAATADAADLAGLQSELDQLLGGQGGGASGGGSGGGSSVITTSTPPTSTPTSGTTTGNPTSTATAVTGPAKLAVNPVTNLRITDDGYTSLTGSWNKSPNATSYLITVLQDGKVLKQQHAVGTIARVGNLKRGTTYDFRVRAQPGGTGGRDANVTATTKKG